jgi:hypothetical protein
MRPLVLGLLLLVACGPKVPVDTLMWRVEGWKPTGAGVRKSPAAIITFRGTGEFVQHLSYVIERPDEAVYLQSGGQHVIIVGKWKKRGNKIVVTRDVVWRTVPAAGGERDPLCDAGPLTFDLSGTTTAVVGKDGQYTPMTRLVSPDFEIYVKDAKRSGSKCAPEARGPTSTQPLP